MKNIGIAGLLERFGNCRILILGDVMVDSYMWGNVSRISPEAPVPVLAYSKSENRLGGAANVALNIHSLGAVPVICSVIGTDENGRIFKELIRELNFPEEGIVESPHRTTTIKTRILAGHQQLMRIDREDDHYLDKITEQLLLNNIKKIISAGRIDAIVFQDYDKGSITPLIIKEVISLGNARNIPTLVDPKKRNFSLYGDATLFKPNYKELNEGINADIQKKDFESLYHAVKKLKEKAGFKMVLLTLSEEGMLLCQGENYDLIPTEVIDVADVSGAGDTVIGMASLCLAAGIDPYDMARLSNLAAGMVCERVGVVPVKKEWLLNANINFGY
ncbi:MAG: hypothetical protein JXB19_03075 [Bacteroidales bacterium]|nr:hypothetical protein [Bacteroidales bacterium]